MIRIRAGLAAGIGLTAALATLPAAAQYPGYSTYRPYTAGPAGQYPAIQAPTYQSNGSEDPAFGYQPSSSLPHPFGPDPGGGSSQHEGRLGVDE